MNIFSCAKQIHRATKLIPRDKELKILFRTLGDANLLSFGGRKKKETKKFIEIHFNDP